MEQPAAAEVSDEVARVAGGAPGMAPVRASGSNTEVRATLDAAIAWGWIDDATEAHALLDRLAAMLWRLSHPRR